MLNRRSFLFGAGATLTALGLPLQAHALSASDRKFVFVFNPGGWDPTRVFAPEFSNPNVDMELLGDRATAGGIAYVDHPDRPSVRTFFDTYHDRALILNGVMVRSIAHEICTMIMLTGTSSGLSPDWPAILGYERRAENVLPHLVLDGPSFPGDLGVAVSRAGGAGQLDLLVSGEAHELSDQPVLGPNRVAENIVDRYLQRRAAARADATRSTLEAELTGSFRDALDKLMGLKDLRYTVDFSSTMGDLEGQARVAAQALSMGVSRCVTVAYGSDGGGAFGWDTHADNDAQQSELFEGLFAGLTQLMLQLESTPGTSAATLADETTVVVLSEMGRTPLLNGTAGKDHWPYTSVMMLGPGITGDRVVGGFDEAYYGRSVDPGTAEIDDGGQVLSAEAVGATLLAMADVDPEPYVSGVAPLTGVLA